MHRSGLGQLCCSYMAVFRPGFFFSFLFYPAVAISFSRKSNLRVGSELD